MVMVDRMSVAAVSRSLRMPCRSVERFVAYYRETGGSLHYDPDRWNRHHDNCLDDDDLRDVVLAVVAAEPEVFLDEIELAVAHMAAHVDGGVGVSASTVRRILVYNGYTRKVIEKAFLSRNEEQRAAWVEAQWRIPLRCRVYLDEAHRVGRSAQRRWAWAVRGERAECYVASSDGARTSFFVAMAHDELLDWMVTRPPPAQASVDFLVFLLNHLLRHMSAYDPARTWADQRDRCVLILDNARVHDDVALTALRDAGVFVLMLPPYSPDFNPIEDVFSVGSSWLRRHSSPAQFNDWPMSSIDTMLGSISGAMCSGFVRAAVRRYLLYVPGE